MNKKSTQVAELASKPAGEDQIARARELCAGSETLRAQLEEFILTAPSRGQMVQYMERLKTEGKAQELQSVILGICHGLGITKPTPSEQLLALQVGLLQEQSKALHDELTQLSKQNGRPVAQSGVTLTSLLAGFVIGGALAN